MGVGPSILVVDVNETLLDIRGMDEALGAAVGHDRVPLLRPLWFAKVLHLSLVVDAVGAHQPFGGLGQAALLAVAGEVGIELDEAAVRTAVGAMLSLPPHREVPAALDALLEGGFRLVALSNGSANAVEAQLSAAGLRQRFEMALSVEAIGRYKPAPEVYRFAAQRLGASPADVRLVAAHDWDCAGAMAAGCAAAYVRRGRPYQRVLRPPDVVGEDLAEVADALLGALSEGTRS